MPDADGTVTGPELLTLERTMLAAKARVEETHAACSRIEGTKRHGSPEHLRRVVEALRAAVAYDEARLAVSRAHLALGEELVKALAKERAGATQEKADADAP
jgi:hypothetical protein